MFNLAKIRELGNFPILFTVFIISLPIAVFLNALTISFLWNWFVVPLGVHPISPLWGLGLNGVFAYFYNKEVDMKKYENEDLKVLFVKCITEMYTRPITAMTLGWLIHYFM